MNSGSLARLMIINLDGGNPAELVRRYLPVARARLGFDVDTVWCNEENVDAVGKGLDGIKVLASKYCPPGSYQLGKHVKGGGQRSKPQDAPDQDSRPTDPVVSSDDLHGGSHAENRSQHAERPCPPDARRQSAPLHWP